MNPLSEGRRELDSVVIKVELTLASIIQGVALFFLTDNARAVFTMRHWASFPYVAAGLCVIFIFWSRSIIHTLTLIRWPMGGHVWLISAQLVSFIAYLTYIGRHFSKIAQLLLQSREAN